MKPEHTDKHGKTTRTEMQRPCVTGVAYPSACPAVRSFRSRSHQRGVTLIDLSIALLMVGLIMGPLLYLYNNQKQREIIAEQRKNFYEIESAIQQFVERNGRYPLPASLLEAYSTNVDDISLGVEFPAGSTLAGCPNINTNGLCIANAPTGDVMIGAVPYSTLGISPEIAVDMWDNKLIYAVTAFKTNAATYTPDTPGTIQLFAVDAETGDPVHLTPVMDSAPGGSGQLVDHTNFDIVLVSTGPSGKGGYTAEGVLKGVCAEPGNPEYEDENCNFDVNFMIDENKRREITTGAFVDCAEHADYCNGTRNPLDGPGFYDDFTYDIKRMTSNLQYDFNKTNKTYVVSEAHRIGIGNRTPSTAIDVRGDVTLSPKGTLTTGKLITPEICDGLGANCMPPRLLAGQVDDMNCNQKTGGTDGVQPLVGIGGNRVVCGTPASSGGAVPSDYTTSTGNPAEAYSPISIPGLAAQLCGPNQYVTRIVGGTPQCADL